MALLAKNGRDRGEQLLIVTERLAALINWETQRIEARMPPLVGAEADEKNRLANIYRLELARIKQEPGLIDGAPPSLLTKLRQKTGALHAELAAHERALGAVKTIAEGLVQVMAAEVARQRAGAGHYDPSGAMAAPSGPIPTIIDRSA